MLIQTLRINQKRITGEEQEQDWEDKIGNDDRKIANASRTNRKD